MTSPSLSVIVPTYNQAGLLRQCLLSLRASGVADLEVIVADDGSTDDTGAVVAREFPEVQYYRRPNSGNPSRPRNEGFALSRGRYVTFLDGDDQWLPDVPARAAALLDRHPRVGVLFADALFGNAADGFVRWITRPGLEPFHRLPRRELEPGFSVYSRGPLFRQISSFNVAFLGACMIRREVFAATGGFDPAYWGAEDWELLMRMSTVVDYGFLSEPMAIYTRHPGNVTNQKDKVRGSFCQALRNVLARCELSGQDRSHVRRRLRQQLFTHAYMAYDRGDLDKARSRFWEAIQAGDRSPATLAYAAMSQLPPQVVGWIRERKRGLGL